MKTLVTHVIPHLDDITALWLLVRYDRSAKDAKLKFVPTAPEGIELGRGETGVGVGRGKYDEHKGDKKDSAASLVWKDLRKRKKLPKGKEGRALEALVDHVRRGDLGEFIGKNGPGFPIATVLRALAKLPGETSRSATLAGFRLLDAMLVLYGELTAIDAAVKRGTEFRTKWGKGVAISVDAVPGMVSDRIAELGYALVVLRFPDTGYLHIRCTPDTRCDLSRLGRDLMKEEPEARWYLHHSKKMLLQGDPIAPVKARSKLGLKGAVKRLVASYG